MLHQPQINQILFLCEKVIIFGIGNVFICNSRDKEALTVNSNAILVLNYLPTLYLSQPVCVIDR